MRFLGNLILTCAKDSELSEQRFDQQDLDVQPEERCGKITVDGRLTVITSPRVIIWYGGSSNLLKNVRRIRIAREYQVVLEGELSKAKPLSIDGGVTFSVHAD